uniref:Uncharacterized protein n=1 Tax=Anguilla anguilla TaxID=7936 RepID=A0A0E9QER3_ANGAN
MTILISGQTHHITLNRSQNYIFKNKLLYRREFVLKEQLKRAVISSSHKCSCSLRYLVFASKTLQYFRSVITK